MSALMRRAILRARRGDDRALADADELQRSPLATDPIFAKAGGYAAGLIAFAGGDLGAAADGMAALPDFSPGDRVTGERVRHARPGDRHRPRAGRKIPEAMAVRDELMRR